MRSEVGRSNMTRNPSAGLEQWRRRESNPRSRHIAPPLCPSGLAHPTTLSVDTLDASRTRMDTSIAGTLDTRLDTSWTPSAARPHGSAGWTA
jgi:hypothetical protein